MNHIDSLFGRSGWFLKCINFELPTVLESVLNVVTRDVIANIQKELRQTD